MRFIVFYVDCSWLSCLGIFMLNPQSFDCGNNMSTHCGWDGKAKEICQWFPSDPIMRSGLYNNSLLNDIWVDSFTWKLATFTLRIVVARMVWFYICCTSCLVFDLMRHLWQRGLISWWWLCMCFFHWLIILLVILMFLKYYYIHMLCSSVMISSVNLVTLVSTIPEMEQAVITKTFTDNIISTDLVSLLDHRQWEESFPKCQRQYHSYLKIPKGIVRAWQGEYRHAVLLNKDCWIGRCSFHFYSPA